MTKGPYIPNDNGASAVDRERIEAQAEEAAREARADAKIAKAAANANK